MNYLLTGPPRCGKTTIIKEIIQRWRKPVGGFYSGKRTYWNGSYCYEDGLSCMWNKEAVKVALVVVNEKQNPIPVMFEDLEVIEE